MSVIALQTCLIAFYFANTSELSVRIDLMLNSHFETCRYHLQSVTNETKNTLDRTELTLDEITRRLVELESIRLVDGGKSLTTINSACSSDRLAYKRVAFIVPYRDRLVNLCVFLNNMHVYLTRRRINYGMYVIEPANGELAFNRGLLMNVGFVESMRDDWNCFVFHDVDMLPEDSRLEYTCNSKFPLHYAVAVSQFNYRYQLSPLSLSLNNIDFLLLLVFFVFFYLKHRRIF